MSIEMILCPNRPERTTWNEFIRTHWDSLSAIDFFTKETWIAKGLVKYMVSVVTDYKTLKVEIAGIIPQANGDWMKQIVRNLLAASGVHPKVAQSLIRHSDINLTMSLYSHTLRGQESEAVENLPDLTLPAKDDQSIEIAYTPAYKKLTKTAYSGCDQSASIGTTQAKDLSCLGQGDIASK